MKALLTGSESTGLSFSDNFGSVNRPPTSVTQKKSAGGRKNREEGPPRGFLAPPGSSSGHDISAKIVCKDGVRTSVFWRKLGTGSEPDVQLTDPKRKYAFGVAVFDNAQVRHAYTPGVLKLKFEKWL
jgi:hypothetical protein